MTTRSIPWPRILAEGFAIVVSILLAFGIQAWWEGRLLEGDRQELLTTMLESVRLNQASITDNLQSLERDQARAIRFLSLPPSEFAVVPGDSADLVFLSVMRPGTRQAANGPLSRSLDGSRLGLIDDFPILQALDRWSVHWSELEERARNLAQAELSSTDALGAHEVYRTFLVQVLQDDLPPTLDLRAVQQDNEVLRATSTMVQERRTYTVYLTRTQEVLHELESLLVERLSE